ncbi:uncharacterized protein A1O5_01393 [Cladophialophora psammophila CBS 110553]|uniref:Peptidase A2 domain-containing protein n=1 Tax=Cladophialophora psammophila CBS 110553 TaxID=1182543 RepID=W9XWR1_9EURO|nr:uncharacterized protein A1O5_01393 [Cladophialophora psammophila CBS 110553]EXJ74699.1 hypothetical protein A1O5_01393 [Cladophialophora psammophila CBS 110553]
MDTGADLNVMTLERAELLGCGTVDQNSGTMLKGIGEKPTLSLGTVRIKFSLRCNSKERWVVFHLVHDLGGHQALLGVGLTMELKHLHRPRCMECERAMPRPV